MPTAADTTMSAFGCVPAASIPPGPWWISGRGEIPFSRSRCDKSFARSASPTETTSGWCRSICPISSSRLAPAASATTPNFPGSASTTERHWRPMDPVEPKMDSCFTESFVFLFVGWKPSDLRPGRVDQYPIIPDNRNGEDERIDSVKHAAMSRQQTPRILDPRAPFIRRFQEVAHLPCHVSHRCHPQQMRQRHRHIPCKNDSHDQRAEETCHRSLPRFLWAQVRRQRMFPDRSPDEISCRITHPDDDHGEEQERRPLASRAVNLDGKRQGKCDENEPAAANSCRRKRFDHGPLCE